VHAQPPAGFLSIDCGYTDSAGYVDKNTTLTYVSDKGYVEGGKNFSILAQYMKDATNKQEETLRSFPDGQLRGADNLLGSGDLELLPIFHFAEIASTTRLFDIYSDGEELFTSFSPSPFQVDSMYQNGRFLRRVNSTFTLRKQPTSQLPPPLINAFE
uniref:Malectin-like domain-containing protein n=1 Tax=Oryza glaberrima TaxID=4538 RepID=I1NSK3_ORYGL